ncbi:unnamed protein product, partial [Arctogadus glacialis]
VSTVEVTNVEVSTVEVNTVEVSTVEVSRVNTSSLLRAERCRALNQDGLILIEQRAELHSHYTHELLLDQ